MNNIISSTNNKVNLSIKIAWVTKSFLDYRIPVFIELDNLCNHQLHIVTSDRLTPIRVLNKLKKSFGDRAHILSGERIIGSDFQSENKANQKICIPYHPRLIKTITNIKPDLLIGDGFFQWSFYALIYKIWKKKFIVICYERTFHTERNVQWYRIMYRRLIMRWVDAVCCNGILSEKYTQSLGFPKAHITKGHMVADVEGLKKQIKFVQNKSLTTLKSKWNATGVVFIFVGHLIERKGLKQLFNAWKEFDKQFPNSGTLIIAGEGHLESELKDFTNRHNLNNVRFVGWIDYDQIGLYYSAADVFVIPTLEDNWSLVVPEAMACSLPILTSKFNGCWPELIKIGKNGWIFDPYDLSDMVNCFRLCIDNSDQLKNMGKFSNNIIQNYSPISAAKAILKAWRK